MRMEASSRTVLAARRQFFQQGKLADALVSAPILRSWQRCAERGLDNARLPHIEPLTARELREATGPHERLRRLCRPEVESLYSDAMATGCVVILTDDNGLILETLGSAGFAARAAQVALRPGVPWCETATGTNAVGTALVEGRPIAVHGGEHYFEPHGILSCSAAPIFDPYGRIVGALDLSGPASVDHRHALGLVRMAVAQIEHRFFDEDFRGRRVLRFQSDPALLGTAREGILVFEDDRLVAANRSGLGLLDIDWSALGARGIGELFGEVPHDGGRTGRLIDAAGRELFGSVDGSTGATVTAPPRIAHPRRGEGALVPVLDGPTHVAVLRAVRLLEADVPVLIRGETGTGKEMVARDIHRRSSRASGPFVAVNCAAIPETLIEAELFGYEEGAFTGARRQGRKGLLREAQGGVLFLDEIGDMPLALQARLLRVLQEREVSPLGGGRSVKVDFALVCATHRDLNAATDAGAFRSDLYFRIAHYTIGLPALRDLPDRLAIVRALWRRLAGDERLSLSPDCEHHLAGLEWPGNFRQLVGTLRVLAALAEPFEPVPLDMLPADIATPARRSQADGAQLDAITRDAMQRTLDACGGNVSRAARELGINRSTLYRRLLNN
ncbi:sigma-54-dependent Fis family transcriptional regulator [Starkeya sp. ORNL1]|uniref:sigma-54-dependent Fis family transcriptional regulator n=1 Tax=Starkeya sp. ORNL1 TaxID=2709380 RepID=UPI001462CA21|nr:sigma-54-dependent Fis family transcriptional regulator [Starkeya sp. ORNL1]QJP13801.1 sigma-54-dependent Fis family transcriptional regulator [Starkeya sp. ORNL1]